MNNYQDYYKTLGIEKKATQDEIQRAYRKLARKYHPWIYMGRGRLDPSYVLVCVGIVLQG